MKIINLKQFLAMPKGTVFMKYEPCVFEDLSVKDDSLAGDFLYSNAVYEIECTGSDDFADKLFDAEEKGTNLTLDLDAISRDGCFDPAQLFAVYENVDIERLIAKLASCLKG